MDDKILRRNYLILCLKISLFTEDVITLDFSKAFDKVNHSVLQQKLCNFGITGSLLQWCESYLNNRRQRVVLDGISSSWSDVSSVRQGFLLGPLFFVIFVSDPPEVVPPGSTIAFMQMTANVPESLTQLVICFNKIQIIYISGMFGIS